MIVVMDGLGTRACKEMAMRRWEFWNELIAAE